MLARFLLPITAAAIVAAIPTAALAAFPHVVAPGESLSSVAAADGLSVGQLAAANGLSPEAGLTSGATLMIPPQGAAVYAPESATASSGAASDADSDAGGSTVAASAPSGSGAYVVQPGDTLSAIAARAGMSLDSLAAANGLDPNGLLLSGRVLELSGSPAVTTQASGATAMSQPTGAPAEGSASRGPYTTAETVSPSEVGQIAAANGVPPSLAEAIAYQESGFNNALTSSADARGVMQILPGTWNWIGQTLAGPTPLQPASALSNVRAGVLLLHSLLQSTGGNPAEAAAGYYQGLSSVRQHGLYPDTQQYVNSVLALERRFGGG